MKAPRDTWVWTGTNWVLQHPSSAPSDRYAAAAAYDAAHNEIVLFGGTGFGDGPQRTDTWTYS